LRWIKKLYSIALADNIIYTKLTLLKVTTDKLNATNTLITNLETARSEYLREKGESQNSTKIKDAALYKFNH